MMLHLELLQTGGEVTMPLYDWQTGKRLIAERPTPPEQVVKR